MPKNWLIHICCLAILGFSNLVPLSGQERSFMLKKDQILVLKDTVVVPYQDTLINLPSSTKYKIKKNPYLKSAEFYDSLQFKAQQNLVKQSLYEWFVRQDHKSEKEIGNIELSENAYLKYQGQSIKEIRFKQVDLLEGQVGDTSIIAITKAGIWLNKTHIHTLEPVLRRNLLFNESDKVDPITIADNERHLRNLSILEDARILLEPHPEDSSQVIAIVITKDRFPWGLDGSFSSFSKFSAEIKHRNIAGTGSRFSSEYLFNSNGDPQHGYSFGLGYENFFNTFASIELRHARSWKNNLLGLNIDRDYLASSLKYLGGLQVGWENDSVQQRIGDSLFPAAYHINYFDIWAARSFQIQMQKRHQLVAGFRYLNNQFRNRPEVAADSNELYYNRDLLLTSLSLSQINYFKSNYILAFGITEDIPTGFRISGLAGYDWAEFENRWYTGFEFAFAKYYPKLGYFVNLAQIGSFVDSDGLTNGAWKNYFHYFSPLLKINRFSVRNFLTLEYTQGVNPALSQSIDLKNHIRGLNGNQITGSDFTSINLESVLFAPWYFYGFKMALFGFTEWGQIEEQRLGIKYKKLYGNIGIGSRIRNESLVFQTIEIQMGQLIKAPEDANPFNIEISLTAPFAFKRIFSYKPRLIPYD